MFPLRDINISLIGMLDAKNTLDDPILGLEVSMKIYFQSCDSCSLIILTYVNDNVI